jgi:hypothetical protein
VSDPTYLFGVESPAAAVLRVLRVSILTCLFGAERASSAAGMVEARRSDGKRPVEALS